MRPLVMDFPSDEAARTVTDQFLFGPALLVSPVTTYQARERSVYLPGTTSWYDFWTGEVVGGGKSIVAPAPFDRIPIHVRAGTILPFGPELQYADEKPSDPTTLVIYRGADGNFTLYDDDGRTFGYEKGAFSKIALRWNDASGTLTIGDRAGSYPGMLKERTFHLVVVSSEHPVPFSFDLKPVKTVTYTGRAVTVKLD